MDEHLLTKSEKEARDARRLSEARDRDAVRWLMGDARGRRFVRKLIDGAGTLGQSFTADPLLSAFNEGRRSVGLRLIDEVRQHAPEAHHLLWTETHE